MLNRLIGGVLLIIGTSIGGGMLALPVVTAQAGFVPAVILMCIVWLLMTISAFWILEVNLWLPQGSNLISMAKATLGRFGQVIAWTAYLLLLYCLLSAYIAGGSDVVQHLLQSWHIRYAVAAVLFVGLLGVVVACGVQSVDWVNRALLLAKLTAYILLVVLAIQHVQVTFLSHLNIALIGLAIMPTITSFGYAIIIPSLRVYLNDDVTQLRRVIMIGGLAPLVFYILWEWATLGAIPFSGEHGLSAMLTSGHATSDLMAGIGSISHSSTVHSIANIFTSICVGTSFLGVSLAMNHFLHDGLHAPQTSSGRSLVFLLMYTPPIFMVLFFPNAFLLGLKYAGTCCVILLLFLPAAMVYAGRYHRRIAQGYQVWGGRGLPVLVMLISCAVIIFDLLHVFAGA